MGTLRTLHATIHDLGEDATTRFQARHNAFYTWLWTRPLERVVGVSATQAIDRAHERYFGLQYEALRRFLRATR